MVILDDLKALDRDQRSAFIASLLGWTLDAFDFFLLTFVVKEIAADFKVQGSAVLFSLMLTLAARPFGALFFGWLADRFGRRPVLMADVGLYSVLELASAFSPSLTTLLVVRTLFGFAMGGEWGIGASLALETIPAKSRGVISGILQEGYALGQLLGALVFWFVYPHLSGLVPGMAGWRVLFLLGITPALLVLYIRRNVKESPAWEASRQHRKKGAGLFSALRRFWRRALYVVILMTAFNFFSHGTQDNYATFLRIQHGFTPQMTGMLTVVMDFGAIIGGFLFGAWSERIGRRRAIVIAALLALPVIWVWAFSATALLLGLGGFLMQISVQGAWGVIPVHLNELSPEQARGTFPGAAYQFGNLFAAGTAYFEGRIAEAHRDAAGHPDYGLALAMITGITAVVIALWTWFGPEAKGVAFAEPEFNGAAEAPTP